MPDDDKIKISALSAALTLHGSDETVINQTEGGEWVTKKMALAVLASFIAEDIEFSSALETEAKTLIGAINELHEGGGGGGSSTLAGLSDVSINTASISNGQILKFNATSQKWENQSGGAAWTDLVGTLSAGATSVSIQNAVITSASTIDIYTDVFGVNPTNIAVQTGQVDLTFESQASAVGVKVRVS